MKEIPLTQGMVALVDDADYEWLTQWGWQYDRSKGYAWRRLRIAGQSRGFNIKMHRLILNLTDPLIEVDHINGNKLDNQRSNLRTCTHFQNAWNRKPIGQSQYKGVSPITRTGKWRAAICYQLQRMYLGSFTSEVDAARAYDAKARELFGEFARLNFPDA